MDVKGDDGAGFVGYEVFLQIAWLCALLTFSSHFHSLLEAIVIAMHNENNGNSCLISSRVADKGFTFGVTTTFLFQPVGALLTYCHDPQVMTSFILPPSQ